MLDRVTLCREHNLGSGARLLVYSSSAPGRGHRAAEILASEKCSVEEALRHTHQEEDAAVAAAIVQAIISRYGFAGERVPVWMREEMDRLNTIDPFSSDDQGFMTN